MQAKTITTTKALALAAFAVLALVLALALQPMRALAVEGSSSAASGSAAESSQKSLDTDALTDGSPLGGLPLTGDDYVWFGRELKLSKATIDNDLLAAGQTISVKTCTTYGDIRAVAQTIDIEDTEAFQNITVAGETVTLKATDGNALALAGQTISYGGYCNSLIAYGSSVFIDGTVTGDVVVGADVVTIGSNANILGTLHVEASQEPVMQRGAQVKDVDFTQTEKGQSVSSDEVEEIAAGLLGSLLIIGIIMSVLGTFIIALLAEWMFKGHTAAAAAMIRNRTGATIGSGIVGALVAPLAIIILCCLFITLPIAGVLTLALLAMTIAAGGFAGASLFKLVFPRMGRYKCAMLGGLIVGVLSAIPFLGSLVQAAAFMYFLGYVLQTIFLNTRKKEPIGGTPAGFVPNQTPISSVPPAGAPMGTAPMGVAPVAPVGTTPMGTAPVAPVTTAPVATAPVTTAPVATAPVATTPVSPITSAAPAPMAPIESAPAPTAPIEPAPGIATPADSAPAAEQNAPAEGTPSANE